MRPQLVDMLVRLLQTLRAILVTLKELREIMKQKVTWAKLKELVTRFSDEYKADHTYLEVNQSRWLRT